MWKRLFGASEPPPLPESTRSEAEIHISIVPSSVYRSPRRQGSAKLQWLGKGQQVGVGGYQLVDPLVYISQGPPSIDEASCLDLSLATGVPRSDAGRELDYWPKYSEIQPDQRATYLYWLANKAHQKAPEMGYVFLYFYGLERRSIIDRQDIPLIRKEILGLLGQYKDNRSFFRYATSLLAYISALEPLDRLDASVVNELLIPHGKPMQEDILALVLAWLAHHGGPLPAQLAYETARQDQRAKNSVVIKRTADEFQTLFAKHYASRYGSGLQLRTAKHPRKITHFAASPTLASDWSSREIPGVPIPNVLGISSQFKGIVEIWNDCIEELKPLSRQRAKGIEPQSREEYEALPVELRKEVEHPDKPLWDVLFHKYTDDRGRCEVPISALAHLINLTERPKLTLRQSKNIVETAMMMGIYVVPSPHTILRPYRWSEPVALVRAKEASSPEIEQYYLAAALMLEMGTAMAAADGSVEKVEMLHVSDVINRMFRFRADEARRLGAYRSLLIRHPPKLTGLSKRLKLILKPDELAGIGEFLVGVAASNGVIDPGERRALKKAYQALGVQKSKLDALLNALEDTTDEPPVVQRGSKQTAGEAIPPRDEAPEPLVTLNREVLDGIIADTAQVAVLIGKAMGELEDSDDREETTLTPPSSDEAVATDQASPITSTLDLSELEPRFHSLVLKIIEKETWKRQEFEKMAQDMGHMVTGAVDAINLWADEAFDDYLIEEDGDDFVIQLNIIEEAE